MKNNKNKTKVIRTNNEWLRIIGKWTVTYKSQYTSSPNHWRPVQCDLLFMCMTTICCQYIMMIFPSNDIVLGILRPLVKWVQSQCLRCMYLCECVCVSVWSMWMWCVVGQMCFVYAKSGASQVSMDHNSKYDEGERKQRAGEGAGERAISR